MNLFSGKLHLKTILLATLLTGFSFSVNAAPDPSLPKKGIGESSTEMPKELKDTGITENLGQKLDLSLMLTNEMGQQVPLSSFYNGHLPVVISMIYYSCPGLCNFHLNGAVEALAKMDWSAGDKYQYLAISFDDKEKSELAVKKKATYMNLYNRPGTENGWHFLTADAATIAKLTGQLGFRFQWNEEAKEWAHASAAIITTPDGTISRYLHGIMFDEKTFKLALNEATAGKIGSFVDKMVWYCFQYDPRQSKYTLYAVNLMKMGGAMIIFLLGAYFLLMWMRSRKEHV